MKTFKRILFYILSFTWGFIYSFVGLIVMLIPFGEYHVYHGRWYKCVGWGWGGVNMGCFFMCSKDCREDYIMSHECGHGLQNIIWGPLFVFVVGTPSMVRYWWFTWRERHNKPVPDYDAAWFEGQATSWGVKYIMTDQW